MRAGEAYLWRDVAAGTYQLPDLNHPNNTLNPPTVLTSPLKLQGGYYEIELLCTGTPALAVEQLGPDGVTWQTRAVVPDGAPYIALPTDPLISIVAVGIYHFWATPGQYRLVISSSTANYIGLTRIPTSE